MLEAMAARTRVTDKRPLERLHERIKTGDRGWFFANIADKVAEQRLARNLSQRELAELCGTTQSAIARLDISSPREQGVRLFTGLQCLRKKTAARYRIKLGPIDLPTKSLS